MSHITNTMIQQVEQYQKLADVLAVEKMKRAKVARDKVEELKLKKVLGL